MTESEFAVLVQRIRDSLGCGKDLAKDYALAIGENPEVAHGKIVVRDSDRRIIAYVPQSVWTTS